MGNNILVTGANGFIGSKLVTRLKLMGYNVFTHNSSDGDITDCHLNFKEIDHVFHLAAKTFVPLSWENPFEFYKVNVIGTGNVLELCRRTGANLTFISTYVYGKPEYLPINEEHPVAANSPYNHSKLLAEEMCRYYSEEFNVKITILRPFNIYGPNQNHEFLIPSVINQAMDKNKDCIEVMNLQPKRDYLYIDDLLNAMLLTVGSKKFDVYNVGSSCSVSVEEIIKIVLKIVGVDKKYISFGNERRNEIMNIVADISKIKKELKWEPIFTLNDGIKAIIANT